MSKITKPKSLNIRTLVDLGLSENEAVLYGILLDLNQATVEQLVSKSPFNRTLLYHILKSLENKNLIKPKKETWKTIYTANSPEQLHNLLNKKEEEFEKQKLNIRKLIPNLQNSYKNKNNIIKSETITGLLEYKKILDEILLDNPKEILCYENFTTIKGGTEIKQEFENKRIYKKIIKNVLFFENGESLNILKKIKYNDYTNFISIKENIKEFTNEMIIYNNKVILINFSESFEPIITKIENKNFYEIQKSIFDYFSKNGINRNLYYTQNK